MNFFERKTKMQENSKRWKEKKKKKHNARNNLKGKHNKNC